MSDAGGLDVSLLQIMKHRKDYTRLRNLVNKDFLDAKTTIILDDFGKFFEATDCEVLPVAGEFRTWFYQAHPGIKQEDVPTWNARLAQLAGEPSEAGRNLIVNKLLEAGLAAKVAAAAERYANGEDMDIGRELTVLVENHAKETTRHVEVPFVPIDEDMFDEDLNNVGFKWRWECMNLHSRPLRGGDFIIMAARPDQGKTTALADNLTYMAPQIPIVFPREKYPENRYILWFNNEGPGKRVIKRVVQSALGVPVSEIVRKKQEGTLWSEYSEAIGGSLHTIRVLDVHGYKSHQIEEIIKRYPPAIIVFDMIDNIKFSGELANGGQRTDQVLEAQYQWARELAVKHDCVAIATSQVSADGEGMAYPTLAMLKDSKTGKQGAADMIVVIGSQADANSPARYIGVTKSKLEIEGQPKSPKAMLTLDGVCGRFIEGVAA